MAENLIVEPPPTISWQELFASVAPNETRLVEGFSYQSTTGRGEIYQADIPSITLKCSFCAGDRLFDATDSVDAPTKGRSLRFIIFQCKNCEKERKTFAVRIGPKLGASFFEVMKFGQSPQYGIELAASIKTLLTEVDLDLFRKGLVAEGAGLGIGAFSYYRRVLDSQREKLFDRVISAAKALGEDKELIDELTTAKTERQFTKAVESIKHALPKFLFIEGHNPLTLLYDAVSNGLHSESDQDCMDSAQTIRRLLTHLLMKVDEALASDDEVKASVVRLLKAKAARATPKK